MKKIVLSVLALAISGVLTVNAQQEPKKEGKKHETMKEKKEEKKEKKEEEKKS
jgi:ribosomal protein L12E/L44/L45/RPP1/RPP2